MVRKSEKFTVSDSMSRRTKLIITGLVGGVVAVAAIGAYFMFRDTSNLPDPKKVELEDALSIVRSNEFWELPPDERNEYARQAAQTFVLRTASEYADLSAEQKERYLDDLIYRVENIGRELAGVAPPNVSRDMEREARQARQASRDPQIPQIPREQATRVLEDFRKGSEDLDARSRAQVTNLLIDMHKHLEERQYITPPPRRAR